MNVSNVQLFASDQKADRGRRRALNGLKWGVSGILLALVLYFADIGEVWQSLSRVSLFWLLAAACLQPIGSLLTALRWRGLLDSQGVQVRLWHLFRSCIAANFFKQFMPSTIGGDAVRAYDSWRAGASKSVAVSTLIVDRLLGLLVLMMFVIVAMSMVGYAILDSRWMSMWLFLSCAALIAVVVAVFSPPRAIMGFADRCARSLPAPASRLYKKIGESVERLRGRHRLLAKSLALSLALQVNVVVFYYLLSRAMGFEIPLALFFLIVPLVTFIMLLPISINGIGVRESAFVVLLGATGAGIASADAVAYAWLEYGVFLFHGVLGGLLYTFTRSPVPIPFPAEQSATGPWKSHLAAEARPNEQCAT